MLIIDNHQLKALADSALAQFEDVMVQHVSTYFPAHFRALQEHDVRLIIRYGLMRAACYGLDTERSVCLYINTMLMLGSNFDSDPLYPWAAEILLDKSIRYQNLRIDRLSDRALLEFESIVGPKRIHLNRALVNLRHHEKTLLQELGQGTLTDLPRFAAQLFPQKATLAGETALLTIRRNAEGAASRYRFTRQGHLLFYAILMFLLGSGFDTDPQYRSLRCVLVDSVLGDEDARVAALYAAALAFLHKFLSAEQG